MIVRSRSKVSSIISHWMVEMSPKMQNPKEESGNSYVQNTRSRTRNNMEDSLLVKEEVNKRSLQNEANDDKPNKRAKTAKGANARKKNKSVQPIQDKVVVHPGSVPVIFDFKMTGQKYVGAHTSVQGGLENSVFDAVKMGARAFGLFLRSQRQWKCKPLEDAVAEKFKKACREHGFSPNLILPHGSYLLNCGSPNEETLKKSREALTDELSRCEKLGLLLYNFHPGSTCGEITIDECIDRIAESINQAHKATTYVITVIENMSCQGYTVGGDFKELKQIIDKVHDKSRIGVCLDTCHAFAAGYDMSTEEGFKSMIEEFEREVGFHYLRAVHLNDSKGKVGCHLDRHENIGKGFIGVKGFERVMNEPRFNDIPMILETPWVSNDINAEEIKLLYSLCNG